MNQKQLLWKKTDYQWFRKASRYHNKRHQMLMLYFEGSLVYDTCVLLTACVWQQAGGDSSTLTQPKLTGGGRVLLD